MMNDKMIEEKSDLRKALDRIKAALGPRLDSLPRLPCGCIDLPVVRLDLPPHK